MKATTRLFAALLFSLFALVAIGLIESWKFAGEVTPSAKVATGSIPDHSTTTNVLNRRAVLSDRQRARRWFEATQGFSLLLCGTLCGLAFRLRKRAANEARGNVSTEVALEMCVEQRTLELRQEVETRRRVEHLNRGHKRILEMLTDPREIKTEDILRYLTATVASRNQGWECALHQVDGRARTMRFVASSDVNEKLRNYFESVSTEFGDTPECQACASGEVHSVEHLGKVGLPWSNLLVTNGIHSVWSVPFCANGSSRLAGTLTVYARSRSKPTSHELDMVESAAKLAALVIEHRRIHSELVHNAYQDTLTGLPNRRAGEQAIDEAIKKVSRNDESLAVVWIDINRFKRTNDQFGHESGDHVLRTIAERLRRNPLSTDAVARMGEDEFLVLVPGTNDSLDPVEISRRLGAAIARPIYAGSSKIIVSASIGVCVYPQDGTNAQTLERNADFAMYRAKSTGEGFCVFSPAMSDEAGESLEIEEALGVALDKNYLRLVYQPLYSNAGELTGFEALLRFHHPSLGHISPARFIPIAEETRLIVPIGNWVLREACRQLRAWQDAGHPPVRMAVNISLLQFARDDFADTVASVLTDCDVSPENLVLELTESVVMEDYDAVVRQMNLLRQCGVHIAMDDFGTGYSSLSYIHRIPVDVLKIDRSFIERLADPEGTRPIVEAVIAMAKHLGLLVIAEGVETQEQQAILLNAGCNGFQGFLFARPLTPEDAEICLKASLTTRFANATQIEGGDLAVA